MRDTFKYQNYSMPKTEDIAKSLASKLARTVHLKQIRKLSPSQLAELKQLVQEIHTLQQKVKV